MAEECANKDVNSLKKTKIQVFVDEALPDILVVTYEFGVKIFKGVLLDSTKRTLPFGIPNINPAFENPPKNLDDDTLYSVNQRFAYTDPNAPKKKNIEVPRKYKTTKMSKMTVRLRPRQVLCSKCKGICNENSENVSKKTRASDGSFNSSAVSKRSSNAPITRSVQSVDSGFGLRFGVKRKLKGSQEQPTLVPKLTRLTTAEEEAIANGTYVDTTSNKKPLSNASNSENTRDSKHSSIHSDSSSDTSEPISSNSKAAKRALRKKRSVGSMEDLWDETVFEEKNKNAAGIPLPAQLPDSRTPAEPVTTNTRTIKISYGPQGEGTVLKIPAQLDSLAPPTDSEENVNVAERAASKDLTNKAARRALKKAKKKEARRKILLSGGSPMYLGGTSPRYSLSSPRYTVGSASPRHGLGNNSPRYMMPPYDTVPRRRKHKMKHKKKHREDKDRKHKEGEVSSTQEDPKDQLITQKLSINLKRLNDSSYTQCTPPEPLPSITTGTTGVSTGPAPVSEEPAGVSSDERSTGSSDQQEGAPDFPPPNPPLVLRVNAQAVPSAAGADGTRLLVGDVVWGKIHGFPWWPGKILTITSYGGAQAPQAHVSWYGSSTSSLMRCDQLDQYLDNFKIRYNKKKKGPYKEAVKQATMEAQENAENRVRQPLGNSPSHNIIPQVVPPALASPREIDVAS